MSFQDSTDPAVTPAPAEKTADEKLTQIIESQAEQRAEIAALKKQTSAPPAPSAQVLSESELRQARLDELAEAEFYCPACGRTSQYAKECSGTPEKPHPPVEMVSTDEVKNPPDYENDPEGYRKWQQGHTAAPGVAA